MSDRSLTKDQWHHGTTTAVELLRQHGVRLLGLFPIPADALTLLLVTLGANRLKYITLTGEPLRHRKALVWSVSFDTKIDETEWSVGG